MLMLRNALITSLLCLTAILPTAARPQGEKSARDVDAGDSEVASGSRRQDGWGGPNSGTPNIKQELGPRLSAGAAIILPQDASWGEDNARWSLFAAPRFQAVVEVASEQDVQNTIRWANKYQIPFLPAGGHHGINGALGMMYNGVEISFARMKTIGIASDGQSATLAPGLHSGELVRALFAQGKRAVTGACLCTGIMGPLLGGGHGLLQGQHGLMVDNLLEARMVLADGSAITVSETQNKDLFWAIRGAGHNFGVVTSIKLKIYDQPQRNWSYLSIIYPGAMVEQVFSAANEFNKNIPAEMTNFIVMRRIPTINPNATVVLSNFFYDGPLPQLLANITPFTKVPQMFNRTGTGPYPAIYDIGQSNETSPQCAGGNYKNVFGVELDNYNPAVERQVYDIFNAANADPKWAYGNVIFESYGRQAVLAVPDDSTAVPFRKHVSNVSPQVIYTDPAQINQGVALGKQIRDAIQSQDTTGQLNSYVNYAFGDEGLKAVYGYEPWRLEKLRRIKRQYDPRGKFNFFAPITY